MAFAKFNELMLNNKNCPIAAAHELVGRDEQREMAEVEFSLLWAAFLGKSGLDPAYYLTEDSGWVGWKVLLALTAEDRYRDQHQSKMMPEFDYQFLKWKHQDKMVREWVAVGDCNLVDSHGNKHFILGGDFIAGWKSADGRLHLPKFLGECTLTSGQLEHVIDITRPILCPTPTTLDIPPGAKAVTVVIGNLSEEDECLEVHWHV